MTAPFGVHPKDHERAEQMFHHAMRAGATTEDVVVEASRWLRSQGVAKDAIAREVKRIRKFSPNPLQKISIGSAWLITWEGTNSPQSQADKIVSILSGRSSCEKVREHIQQLHVDLLYSLHEKVTYARKHKSNPYPAEYFRINGVQWSGRITCGRNPHLLARKVKGLKVICDKEEQASLEWKELPIPQSLP